MTIPPLSLDGSEKYDNFAPELKSLVEKESPCEISRIVTLIQMAFATGFQKGKSTYAYDFRPGDTTGFTFLKKQIKAEIDFLKREDRSARNFKAVKRICNFVAKLGSQHSFEAIPTRDIVKYASFYGFLVNAKYVDGQIFDAGLMSFKQVLVRKFILS